MVQLIQDKIPKAKLSRKIIEGESSLLLLEGHLSGERLSIGIRNSGTEAKTSLTIKSERTEFGELAAQLIEFLSGNLID